MNKLITLYLIIMLISTRVLGQVNNINVNSVPYTMNGTSLDKISDLNLIKGADIGTPNSLDDDHIISSTVYNMSSSNKFYSCPRITAITPSTNTIQFDKVYHVGDDSFVSNATIYDNVNNAYVNAGMIRKTANYTSIPLRNNLYLMQLDNSGNVNWSKEYPNVGNAYATSITLIDNIPTTSSIYNQLNSDGIAYAVIGYSLFKNYN